MDTSRECSLSKIHNFPNLSFQALSSLVSIFYRELSLLLPSLERAALPLRISFTHMAHMGIYLKEKFSKSYFVKICFLLFRRER